MNIDEITQKVEKYVFDFVQSRYATWEGFYHYTVDNKRKGGGIYSLKHGNLLMDTLDNIFFNLEDLCVSSPEDYIPKTFASVEFLVGSLNKYASIVTPAKKLLNDNVDEKPEFITNDIVPTMLKMIAEIQEMARVCNDLLHVSDINIPIPYSRIVASLLNRDIKTFIQLMSSIVESIPYSVKKEKLSEAYFHSLFHILLAILGFEPVSEGETASGRIDVTLSLPRLIYIFEFKYTDEDRDKSDDALQQIKDKGYAKAKIYIGKEIIGVGVSFSGADGKRNINGYKVVTLAK